MAIPTSTINQKIKFNCTPEQIYEAFMDSKKHSKFTDTKSVLDPKVGGKFVCGDGYMKGKTIELIPNQKIVQTWNADQENWPKKHFSEIILFFKEKNEGTELQFTHDGVPEVCVKDIEKGWYKYYWDPLKEYFNKLNKKKK